MVGVREHIDGGDVGEGVAAEDEAVEIAGEGGGVAGDVDDAAGLESAEGVDDFGVAALTRADRG